jgi:hypothetical protein
MRTLVIVLCGAILLSGCLSTSNGQPSGANDTESKGAIQDMKGLLYKGQGIGYVAAYIITYSALVNASPIQETYYFGGRSGNARVDIKQGNESGSVFKLGNSTYACQPKNGSMSCALASENISGDEDFASSLEENIDFYKVQSMPDRTILNLSATCFRVTMRDGNSDIPDAIGSAMMSEDMEFGQCFSEDGIVLEFQSPFSRMSITGLNMSVPDSAFVLPAEPE